MHVVDMGQVVSLTLPTHALFLSMYLMGGGYPHRHHLHPPDLGGSALRDTDKSGRPPLVAERVSKPLDGGGGESHACVFKKLSTIIRVHDHTWVLHSDGTITCLT
jgi:hypothetical protein